MSIIARILATLVYASNLLIILFGVYGYLLRSRFVSGEMGAPFWLLQAYQTGAPFVFYMVALGLGAFGVIRILTGLFRSKLGEDYDRLFTALRIATVLGGAAALPACQTQYKLLDSTEFNNQQYHLVQHVDQGQVAYGVFACPDVGSFYCQLVNNNSRPWHGFFPAPPPDPTPLPTRIVTVDNQQIILEPRGPTPTPPAEFIVSSYDLHGRAEQELSIQIGQGLLGVDYVVEETPEP